MNDIACWAEEYGVFREEPVYTPGAGGEDFEIHGLLPERVRLEKKEHPFKADHVTRRTNIMFQYPDLPAAPVAGFHDVRREGENP
jgi:D-amino-acid oxidase